MGFPKSMLIFHFDQHGGDEVEQLQGHFFTIPNNNVSELEKERQK